MQNYHIKHHESHWDLTKEGADRASFSEATKEACITRMETFMADKTGSVKIHGLDGKIQEERTYPRSADPHKSKG